MSPRRMPTKIELLRLQKLYRTDKKIAEVLGNGVTEHLVAYWRRKKGIQVYSFPKFSEKDIREVWDRFGDDFHAGMELGISKAAFYNWRRRYKITKKPEALKLEQLSLELFTADSKTRKRLGTGSQTIVRKMLARNAGARELAVAESVDIEPDLIVTSLNAGEILDRFQQTGLTFVKNPARIVISLDGTEDADRVQTAATRKALRDFVRRQQIRNFFDVGEGSPHQLAVETGLALPGQITVGAGRHAASLGCMGALALIVDAKTIADAWTRGKIAINVPATIRVIVSGRPPRGVFARDVAHTVIAGIPADDLAAKMIEFYGGCIDQMSISERFTLCSLISTTGAVAALCPFDATTRRYVNPRARRPFTPMLADRHADYAAEYTFDVNTMRPVAAGPDDLSGITRIDAMSGVPVQHLVLGGTANGRFDDLRIAAEILKGKKINPESRLIIQPASRAIYLEALKKGLIRVFIEAGAMVVNPGRPLDGAQVPLLAPDEIGLTTHNDLLSSSDVGKMYQASPATVAASSVTGRITNPAPYVKV